MKKVLILLVFLAPLFFGGCSGSDSGSGSSNNENNNKLFEGKAMIDEPIVGGDVTVSDKEGNLLLSAKNITNENGSFGLLTKSLPDNFVIKIAGGLYKDQPFEGVLIREVKNYDHDEYLYVNEVTTLTSRYMENSPELSPEAALAEVKRFLGIADYIDILKGEQDTAESAYNSSRFALRVQDEGGFEFTIDSLLQEIANGYTPEFPVSPPENGDVLVVIAQPLAKKLLIAGASAVAGKAGTETVNWVTTNILGFDTTDAKLADIRNEMKSLKNEVTNMGRKLSERADYQAILTQYTALQPPASYIEAELNRLQQISDYTPTGDAAKRAIETLQTQAVNIPAHLILIHHILTGTNVGSESLISNFFNATINKQLLDNDVSNKTEYFEGFFKYYVDLQLSGLLVIVEAKQASILMYKGTDPYYTQDVRTAITSDIENNMRYIREEAEIYRRYMEVYAYIRGFELGRPSDMAWTGSPGNEFPANYGDANFRNSEFSVDNIHHGKYVASTYMNNLDKYLSTFIVSDTNKTLPIENKPLDTPNQLTIRFISKNNSDLQYNVDTDYLRITNKTTNKTTGDFYFADAPRGEYYLLRLADDDYRVRRYTYSNLPDGEYSIDTANPVQNRDLGDGVIKGIRQIGHPYLDYSVKLKTTEKIADAEVTIKTGNIETITILPYHGLFANYSSSGFWYYADGGVSSVLEGNILHYDGAMHTYYFPKKETAAIQVSYSMENPNSYVESFEGNLNYGPWIFDLGNYPHCRGPEPTNIDLTGLATTNHGTGWEELHSWKTNFADRSVSIDNGNSEISNFELKFSDTLQCQNPRDAGLLHEKWVDKEFYFPIYSSKIYLWW